jgi:hypothetical protein
VIPNVEKHARLNVFKITFLFYMQTIVRVLPFKSTKSIACKHGIHIDQDGEIELTQEHILQINRYDLKDAEHAKFITAMVALSLTTQSYVEVEIQFDTEGLVECMLPNFGDVYTFIDDNVQQLYFNGILFGRRKLYDRAIDGAHVPKVDVTYFNTFSNLLVKTIPGARTFGAIVRFHTPESRLKMIEPHVDISSGLHYDNFIVTLKRIKWRPVKQMYYY